jgi:hypothetical protein
MAENQDVPRMTRHNPSTVETMPVIDIGCALDLLATAVEQRGEYETCAYAPSDVPWRLVCHVLSLANVGDDELKRLDCGGVRELYARGALPVRLTLGGLAVLDAAERAQNRGYAWRDALGYASNVAVRFVNLLPDAAFPKPSPTVAENRHPKARPTVCPAGSLPGPTAADQRGRSHDPPGPPSSCELVMKIPARQLTIGDVLLVNDWQLHVTAVEHELATAIGTAEFEFLLHFTRDDFVDVVGNAQESAVS